MCTVGAPGTDVRVSNDSPLGHEVSRVVSDHRLSRVTVASPGTPEWTTHSMSTYPSWFWSNGRQFTDESAYCSAVLTRP